MHIYTIKELKKHIVTLSSEKIEFTDKTVKEFVAKFNDSLLVFPVPAEIIKVLGRLFQKNDHLELGYLEKKETWFILRKYKLLWSSKIINMERIEKPKFNRFTALTKNNLNSDKK